MFEQSRISANASEWNSFLSFFSYTVFINHIQLSRRLIEEEEVEGLILTDIFFVTFVVNQFHYFNVASKYKDEHSLRN